MRKIVCFLLVCAMICWNPCVGWAVEEEGIRGFASAESARATAHFNLNVGPLSRSNATDTFSMEAGEVVRIYATFSPLSSSIQVGLVNSDGGFYNLSITGGKVDVAFKIEERGEYRLAVKNNSLYVVTISGNVDF